MAQHQREAINRYLRTLPADAPLHSVVNGAEVQGKLESFEAADAQALAQQDRYWKWGRSGIRATTFGIIVGALLLFPIDAWVTGSPRLLIGGLQTLALAVTFGVTLLITWLKPVDAWMLSRADAERLRGEIFASVVNAEPPITAAPQDLGAQKLGLVMTAYLNDQLGYFDDAMAKHKRLASKFSPLRLVGYFLIICAAIIGAAVLLEGLGMSSHGTRIVSALAVSDANRWQLGIATIASGILAHATARTLMDEDERKSALYAVTARKLRALIDRELPKMQTAITEDHGTVLREFFLRARNILEQEHAVWSFAAPLVNTD